MSPARPADRLVWAVGTLDVAPDHQVLEVGCGHGVAVTLIADALVGGAGHVVGLDRSATMTAAAARRNAAHVAAGRASFVTAELADADLGDARFDRVLAVHLPVLDRGDPAAELAVLRRHLAPGGRLHVAAQPLDPAGAEPAVERLRDLLPRHGFTVADVLVADLPTGRNLCVVATG